MSGRPFGSVFNEALPFDLKLRLLNFASESENILFRGVSRAQWIWGAGNLSDWSLKG